MDEDQKLYIIGRFERFGNFSTPTEIITACSDPKDNKFLELAIACQATCIISGDNDLLDLHPFRSIPILNANDFLSQFS